MKKKILSGVLAFALLFGSSAALPEGVFETSSVITASADSTATSGKCGENVSWSLKNGVLTISGKGNMNDYNYSSYDSNSNSPFVKRTDIKSVVIKSGVTSIGSCTFVGCSNLKSVTIENSVTYIGSDSFGECTSLASVTIPNSVKYIDFDAFRSCTSLKKITIPNSVTSIYSGAFSGCSNLESVIIPKSVTIIGGQAFYGTKWLENQQKKSPFVVVNGMLIDGTTCKGKVTIPSSVKSIGDEAFFNCTSLTSVTIPSSVKSIGVQAFYECKNLTSVTIPSSVTSIGNNAFSNTKWLENQQKKSPFVVVNGILIDGKKCEGKVTIPSNVKSIGKYAFSGCNSVTSVTIPNSVKSIGEHAFYYCTSLKTVTIKSGVTSIGHLAFYLCTSLASINIPNSVTSIGDYAFTSCEKLAKVTIPSSVAKIGTYAFGLSITSINVSKDNKNFCSVDGSLYNKKKTILMRCDGSKKTLTVPNTVKTVAMGAFAGCAISSVTIPDSVETIEPLAFYYCKKLKKVIIPNKVKKIDEQAFSNCTALSEITIPNSVTSIEFRALDGCTGLKSVTIPSSVTAIADYSIGYEYDWSSYKKIDDFVIHGVKGTAAEKYAKENGFKFVARRTTEPKVSRFAGANRYDTAALISQGEYKNGTGTVVIATGLDFHDALVAVPLANAYNAPLLLTTDKQVTKQTEAELARLKAKKVIIVSTNGAVGTKVKAALAKYNPTMISGDTCYETATKVAEAMQKKAGKAPDTIFFATSGSFADALSVSPVAAIKNAPIIYLVNNTANIDPATAAYLKSVKGKVKNAYVIGGDGVISDAMMKNVATALGLKVGSTVQRVAGANRYETCVAVNKKFKSVVSSDGICVAKGLDFPDALAGGVYAAKTRQALFLADGKKLQDVQGSYLKGKNASKITVFGGIGAVPDELVKLIAKASV